MNSIQEDGTTGNNNKRVINLKLKIGGNELELSGPVSDVIELINMLLPHLVPQRRESFEVSEIETSNEDIKSKLDEYPVLNLRKDMPLTEILTKVFDTKWGHTPRLLKDVIELLNSYGLYYPKSTVAVTLNRLAQRGIIRRIRGKDKHFLYVSAKPLTSNNLSNESNK